MMYFRLENVRANPVPGDQASATKTAVLLEDNDGHSEAKLNIITVEVIRYVIAVDPLLLINFNLVSCKKRKATAVS